ncbi:MAG: TetR/AcrR family transcriptional regulator [Acidobacteriota bacterium]
MVSNTRMRFLEVATRHFAENGFDGASIAAIARALGLTKQALIHHFGSKEKLYGEVLQQISDRLLSQIIQANVGADDPATRLEDLLLSLHEDRDGRADDTRLVLRELLDNKRRAERATNWYLKPYLDALTTLMRQVPGWETARDAEALAAVYQIIGAIYFFAISEPTLVRMFGERAYDRLETTYPARLRALIRACLRNPPAAPG